MTDALSTNKRKGAVVIIGLLVFLLSGCGLLGPERPETSAEPAAERQLVPTFTPTATVDPQQVAQVEPTPLPPTPVPPTLVPAEPQPEVEAVDTAMPEEEPVPETINLGPQLVVDVDIINVRSGPSTAYAIVGAASKGDSYEITGKNQAGDWWEVCCIDGQAGWIYGPLAVVQNTDTVAVARNIPTPPPAPTPVPIEEAPAAAEAQAEEAAAEPSTPPDPAASSAGWFDPNAQYHVTNLRVLGLGENNGGIRSRQALHYILITVLDENGNPAEGAVVRNLVGDKLDHPTGNKGPGRTEITMFWEPYKLTVVSDATGPVTSQVSNQMGLAFPHLPDIVGKLGDENYEYGACPTLEIRCEWPITALHFSYEITFQKKK